MDADQDRGTPSRPSANRRPMLSLEQLRQEIDAIDGQILELLAQRVGHVLAVGEYKRAHGLPIYDPERERSLLERLAERATAPLERDTVRRVFERVVDECRSIELHHNEQATPR